MTTLRIHRWNRRYRLRDSFATVCEHLANTAVPVALDEALADTLPDDREVILLRRVALRFTAPTPLVSPLELAQPWGRAMATAVHQAIERNDPRNVRRFECRAEHVVSFLDAWLTQRDADAWYFATLRDTLAAPSTVDHTDLGPLLIRYLDDWPEVLARLGARGLAAAVLRRVSQPVLQQLWNTGIRGLKQHDERSGERGLFAAALGIARAAFGYVATSEEAAAAYAAFTQRLQPATDWTDTTHLAAGVAAAVQFLLDRGAITVDSASATLSSRIAQAVAPLDWLDREWLQRNLIEHVVGDRRAPSISDSAVAQSASPLHSAWEQIWTTVERRIHDEQRASPEPSTAITERRLLALALMVEQNREWIHDPALALFVADKCAQLWPAPERATAPVRMPQLPLSQRSIATDYAGVFLLARALHDLRLAGLARRVGFPCANRFAPALLFQQLASLWAERPLPPTVDPGLLAFARLGGPAEWHELATPLPASDTGGDLCCASFQSGLAQTLVELGSWSDVSQLSVVSRPNAAGQPCWLAGDAATQLYPWCTPNHPHETAATIEHWRAALARFAKRTELPACVSPTPCVDPAHTQPPEIATDRATPAGADSSALLTELTLQATGDCVLRHWARSLQGLQASSVAFLLRQFVHRAGSIRTRPQALDIELEPRPLDAALDVSGLLETFDYFNGTELIQIRFRYVT